MQVNNCDRASNRSGFSRSYRKFEIVKRRGSILALALIPENVCAFVLNDRGNIEFVCMHSTRFVHL